MTSVQLVLEDDSVVGPFDTPDPAEYYVFELSPAVTAQRVRVEAVTTSGGNTGAREVQFLVMETAPD